jgi:hypothetical protein
VPEVVFLRNFAIGNDPNLQIKSANMLVLYGVGPNSEPLAINIEINASAHPGVFFDWLQIPRGVEISSGGWTFSMRGSATVGVRVEISDGRVLMAEAVGGGRAEIKDSITIDKNFGAWLPEWPAPGEYSVDAVIFLDWSGSAHVKVGSEVVLGGFFSRSLVIDPWTHNGDARINLGTYCVVDLALVEIKVVGYAGGDGSAANPYAFFREDDISANDLRVFNGNPTVAKFMLPGSADGKIATIQPYEEIAATDEFISYIKTDPAVYESIYEVIKQRIFYNFYPPYSPDCLTRTGPDRSIHVVTYRELADINKVVIRVKPDRCLGGSGTENDPYVVPFSDTEYMFEAENLNTLYAVTVNQFEVPVGGKIDLPSHYITELRRSVWLPTPTVRTAALDGSFFWYISCPGSVNRIKCFFNSGYGKTTRNVYLTRAMPTKEEFLAHFLGVNSKLAHKTDFYVNCSGTLVHYGTVESLGVKLEFVTYDLWAVSLVEYDFSAGPFVVDTVEEYGEEKIYMTYFKDNIGPLPCGLEKDIVADEIRYDVVGYCIVRLTDKETGRYADYRINAEDIDDWG